MNRAYYSASITGFLEERPAHIIGELALADSFAIEASQRDAWIEQIRVLKQALAAYRDNGAVYFEYTVPRLGKRIDVVAIIQNVVFVIEFKVGQTAFTAYAIDQVWDYALDLKNFHEASHDKNVAPVLVATGAERQEFTVATSQDSDGLLRPMLSAPEQLARVFSEVLAFCDGPTIDCEAWGKGRYSPTPNIVEAAIALYSGHSVASISRSDAGATNLTKTSDSIAQVIRESKTNSKKSICFVTGVPGSGKTLVGLNVATTHIDRKSDLYSVYLSGNGPLVAILREALARDKVRRDSASGGSITKTKALSEVKLFVQNVHHFRDDCLVDPLSPPIEHVALFDEAQRAWDLEQTASFMRQKKGRLDFRQSEPEFLISCMDRHNDWAVVVCLVGGGQEINRGEAGISEWIDALLQSFPHWHIFISPSLSDAEYGAGKVLERLQGRLTVDYLPDLHLSVSMRSFRAETISTLVKQLLDLNEQAARELLEKVEAKYPIVVTRDLNAAKAWLKERARGSERYGMIVSSQAERLKPHAIDVRSPMDPIHWFLDGKDDVRSSYFLEAVATEFDVQGLELDWACVVWDADFRYSDRGWQHHSFVGDKWLKIIKAERQRYLKNAYRVLLTRARQGMVIVVPYGSEDDTTRQSAFYDPTFDYLVRVGFTVLAAPMKSRGPNA